MERLNRDGTVAERYGMHDRPRHYQRSTAAAAQTQANPQRLPHRQGRTGLAMMRKMCRAAGIISQDGEKRPCR